MLSKTVQNSLTGKYLSQASVQVFQSTGGNPHRSSSIIGKVTGGGYVHLVPAFASKGHHDECIPGVMRQTKAGRYTSGGICVFLDHCIGSLVSQHLHLTYGEIKKVLYPFTQTSLCKSNSGMHSSRNFDIIDHLVDFKVCASVYLVNARHIQ